MAFETLPVVHLDGGRFPEFPEADVERVLTGLARRFGRVVVVDAEGVRRNRPELEVLQAAARRRSVWVDAGSRFATDAMDLFIAGAETVTMRWNTLDDAKELEEAADLCNPESLLVGLEYPRGGFLRNRRDARPAADVVRLAERLDVGQVHFVERGDESAVRALPFSSGRRFVHGPVWGQRELLEELGFVGALVPAPLIPDEKADEGASS